MDNMGFLFPIALGIFGILFGAGIYIKCAYDNKKEKKNLTEIIQKYGVKANARIEYIRRELQQCGMSYKEKYVFSLNYEYDGEIYFTEMWTTNSACMNYSSEIPIIFIPHNNKELLNKNWYKSYKINLVNIPMPMFYKDLNIYTNLTESYFK